VQNDARIAKLLTKYLQGQNGKASKKHHLKLQYDSAVSPFNGLIETLIAQIELVPSDYNKIFT